MTTAADIAGRTTAIVLASGLSRRFGEDDKLLGDLAGRPLAAHIGATLGTLALERRLAVCASPPVAALYRALGFALVCNDAPEKGMGHSLKLGIDAAAQADYILVCLADMPLIDAHHLEKLFAEMAQHQADAIGTVAGGVPSPPALFTAKRLGQADFSGDAGARALIRGAKCVAADLAMVSDIDAIADLEHVNQLLSEKKR